MKILVVSIVTNITNHDASYTHSLCVAQAMKERGHKVQLYYGGQKNKKALINNIKVHILRYFSLAGKESLWKKIIFVLANNFFFLAKNIAIDTDIIYERYSFGNFGGLIISIFFKKTLIYEVNGIPDEEIFLIFNIKSIILKKLMRIFINIQLKLSKGIVVPTNELKEIIESKFNIKKVYLVPNGCEQVKKNIAFKKNKIITMTYVGTLDRTHNLDTLLRSIALISSNFRFNIIGGGEDKNNYIEKYSDDVRFNFLGYFPKNKASEVIETSDICLAAYNREYPLFKKYGFYFCPLKILEYMSYGKPILVYGLKNSFINTLIREEAIIFSSNKKDLIKKLEIIIKDNKMRSKLSANSIKIAKNFTWDDSVRKIERIIYAV